VKTRVLGAWVFVAFVFWLSAAVLTAQAPDCKLGRRAFDNYLTDGTAGGFTAPRYVHHALHLGLSLTIGETVHRTTPLGRLPSDAIGSLALAVPHFRDLAEHRRVGERDALADAVIASEPLIASLAPPHDWRSLLLTGIAVVGSYFAVACYASP